MSLLKMNTWHHEQDLSFPEIEEFAIGGKLVAVAINISEEEVMVNWDDATWKEHIRQKIVSSLVDRMLKDKFVEITSTDNPVTNGKMIYARCYLAPKEQVKILRTLKKP